MFLALQACGDAAGPRLDDTVAASVEIVANVVALESGDKAQFMATVQPSRPRGPWCSVVGSRGITARTCSMV